MTVSISPLTGSIEVPGDKSITHRAFLFALLAESKMVVRTRVLGRDNFASLRIVEQLGAKVDARLNESMFELAKNENVLGIEKAATELCEITIEPPADRVLASVLQELDCGNSGTTARLLTGILATSGERYTLVGDESLSKRPFDRVKIPLEEMGASFSDSSLPLEIQGGDLRGIKHHSPKASAQVKSAILLAGLRAKGEVVVIEPRQSRDHTEKMFSAMGVEVDARETREGWTVSLPADEDKRRLSGIELEVPGDISGAAFFIVASSLVPGSEIVIKNVCCNPTRMGVVSMLQRMGANISLIDERLVGGEQVFDIRVSHAQLSAVTIDKNDVVLGVDEIPVVAIAAAFARGETVISGAGELRVKESDRLAMTAAIIQTFGGDVDETPDGLVVRGNPALIGGGSEPREEFLKLWQKTGDHRISMAAAVMEYALTGSFSIAEPMAVETSFPNFSNLFSALGGHCRAG